MSNSDFIGKHFNKVFKKLSKSQNIENFEAKISGKKDKVIVKNLSKVGIYNKRCLDIGPGSGRWLNYLKKGEAKKIYAIDISEKVINLNKSLCTKIFKLDIEVQKMPLPNSSIDIILCIEVLEHIRDPESFILELGRIMSPNSIAIFTMPNILSFSSRIRMLFGFLPIAIISDPTHVKFYRRKSILKLFSKINAKIEFHSSSFSLNPFNQKSKFRVSTFSFFSSLDDSLIFTLKKNAN